MAEALAYVIATTPPESYATDRRYQRVLLVVVMLAVTAFGSLMTLITVALDDMGADLGASRVTMTWAITGLMLIMAVATPMAGTLGDVHGHRKVAAHRPSWRSGRHVLVWPGLERSVVDLLSGPVRPVRSDGQSERDVADDARLRC